MLERVELKTERLCEQAPTSITCKDDIVALCVTCNSDIYSTNPRARRHERVPVKPFFDSAECVVKSSITAAAADTSFNFVVPTDDGYGQDMLKQPRG
ncbi:zinc finger constans-like protein, putative [Medicago truncatula]|uniref:Zinc finger constans-like protein, putative n=1 Tax=Medicago truncatula TaxID=3880 RepID=G7IZM1_MEDTR|nr:zinc finger constans-like protein, putative [Medicago truncatula]